VSLILQRAAPFLPALDISAAAAAAIVRVGLRPQSSGGLPLVGSVPGVGGLLVNAGHSGSGLLLSPITSAVVLQALTGTTGSDHLTPAELAKLAVPLAPPRPVRSQAH